MKRTAEKLLGIISIILNALFLFALIFFMFIGSLMYDEDVMTELEEELYADPTLTEEEIQEGLSFFDSSLDFIMGFSSALIFAVIVSIVLSIIGVVQMDKKPKNAGIMLIISSVLSGVVLSLQGILLLIAGIMAIVRKDSTTSTPVENQYN